MVLDPSFPHRFNIQTSKKIASLFLPFLSCFPYKQIPMTAQAALGVKHFLCHSYSESLYVTMATLMEGGREA